MTAATEALSADLFAGVVGQDDAVATLRALTDRPVHAFLFVGPEGSGRLAAALAFGAALVCPSGGCGACRSCRNALSGAHPDVRVATRSRSTLPIGDDRSPADAWTARRIVREAQGTPVEGARQVFVVPEFESAQPEAVPALLKTIEEPPPASVLILIANGIRKEWDTIASRCAVVRFRRLSPEAVAAALVADGHPAEVAEATSVLADGNLARARDLVSDPTAASRWASWQAIPSRLDGRGSTVAAIADEIRSTLDDVADSLLAERHATERAELETQIEEMGTRRGALGELDDQHRQERRRVRESELRACLAAIGSSYRAVMADRPEDAATAVDEITRVTNALERNPNEQLLLWRLLWHLPPLG